MAGIFHSQLDEPTAPSSNLASPSSSSDKENPRPSLNKRNTAQMTSPSASKRRRLTDRNINSQSQMSSSRHDDTSKYYDPDQDPEERRRIRKGIRDLTHDFNDSRTEYMQAGNDGILKTIHKANQLYVGVKQTSDATLDSRLLVNAADLSHKRTAQLALGNTTAGIDVDVFVTKCISYMRRGPDMSTVTQNVGGGRRRRTGASQRYADEGEDGDNGDAMNWDWLARTACLPYNARPTVSGWLLGPLSLQKRTRQLTQRAPAEKFDPTQAKNPNELRQEDLSGKDDANLTTICQDINTLLGKVQEEAQDTVDRVLSEMDDPDEDTMQRIMAKHDVADDGGVPLFRFCINPRSFGQSVENLFYVSFLVRDGSAGVSVDSRGLPTLHTSSPHLPSEAQAQGVVKRQAIFSLDFKTWEQLVDVFGIESSIIPHRNESTEEAATTWS
ncbi:hypothetical protein N7466_000417 [Penicillium verhagenii]|uniref:uncharacterized protein n=1 Tax=Penicillium verhagenii TaxID=1562060 RepID=UPI002544F9C7|nr:uncharacterized protein N7466_000417 [Penicillium verhagenii]KAJ5947402.1 hypothetical protein N7466_000417 [Penicillium verhagenii]